MIFCECVLIDLSYDLAGDINRILTFTKVQRTSTKNNLLNAVIFAAEF